MPDDDASSGAVADIYMQAEYDFHDAACLAAAISRDDFIFAGKTTMKTYTRAKRHCHDSANDDDYRCGVAGRQGHYQVNTIAARPRRYFARHVKTFMREKVIRIGMRLFSPSFRTHDYQRHARIAQILPASAI